MRCLATLSVGLALNLGVGSAFAGDVEVLAATAQANGNSWRFEVTVRHADTGWEHYADAWRIVGLDGTVYGTRTLHHPHVEEQPFTRSLAGVVIPPGVSTVIVQARDSVHGWGAATFSVDLPL